MPIDVSAAAAVEEPVTPTTAFSFSSASVVAGSSRSTLPALIAAAIVCGSASTSTLRPTASAVFGLTPGPTPPFFAPAIAWCSCSASPQNASSAEGVVAEDLSASNEELLRGPLVRLIGIGIRPRTHRAHRSVDDHQSDIKDQPTDGDERQSAQRFPDHTHEKASARS